jgi:hypothetical protein
MSTLVPEKKERPSVLFERAAHRCDGCRKERTVWKIRLGYRPGIFLCADCLVWAARQLTEQPS